MDARDRSIFRRSVIDPVGRRPYAAAAAIALAAMLVPHLLRTKDWHLTYLPAARDLAAGEPFDLAPTGDVDPPPPAFLAVPFAQMPRWAAGAAFAAINMAALALFWRWSWRLSGGRVEPASPASPWREHAVLALGLACGFRFVTDALDQQQTDLFIAALMTGGCMLLARERFLAAAAVLGLAAAFKAVPLVWGLWFAARRKWAAAAVLPAVMLAANLVPDLVYPPPGGRPRIAVWFERHVMPIGGAAQPAGLWYTMPVYNQSLSGTLLRLFRLPLEADIAEKVVQPAPDAGFSKTVLAVELALVLACGVALWRSRPEAGAAPPDGRSPAFGFGAILMLMLLISPASSKPHFVTVFLPALAVARRWLYGGDRVAGALLLVAAAASLGSNRIIFGAAGGWGLWFGGPTWCALALLAACLWCLRQPAASAISYEAGGGCHSPK